MTFSQAHYRLVFQEYGVTDLGIKVACEGAKMIVGLYIDDFVENLNPPKLTSMFDLQNRVFDAALNPRIFHPYPYTLMM